MPKLSKLGGSIERGIHATSRSSVLVAAGVLFLMMLLTFGDVIGRYFFNNPIKGAQDATELMLVLAVFLAAGYTTARRSHIRVDVVLSKLPRYVGAILSTITIFVSAGALVFVVWQIGTRAWDLLLHPGPHTAVILAPIGPFVLVAAIGCLMLCVELWLQFFHSFADWRSK